MRGYVRMRLRGANDRHTQQCPFGCPKLHWTPRNIGLKLLWKFRALLRLRFKLYRLMGWI